MIELKNRPQKPQGKKILEKAEIELFPPSIEIPSAYEDGDVGYDYEDVPNPSLAEVVEYFEDKGIDISKVFPTYGYSAPSFSYTVMEPQEECNARAEQYKKDLKEYQEWYKENKDEIKAAKAAIKAEKDKEKKEVLLRRRGGLRISKRRLEKNLREWNDR